MATDSIAPELTRRLRGRCELLDLGEPKPRQMSADGLAEFPALRLGHLEKGEPLLHPGHITGVGEVRQRCSRTQVNTGMANVCEKASLSRFSCVPSWRASTSGAGGSKRSHAA